MEVSSSNQMKENHEDPWEFLEKELQEFEKAMKALEEGNLFSSTGYKFSESLFCLPFHRNI